MIFVDLSDDSFVISEIESIQSFALSPYRYFYTCKKPLITGLRRILIVVPARNEKNDRSPTSINVGVPKRNFTSNLP